MYRRGSFSLGRRPSTQSADTQEDKFSSEGEKASNDSTDAANKKIARSSALERKEQQKRQSEKASPMIRHDEPKSTFVDAAAMKEKVREKLTRPKYNVFDFYHEQGCAQYIGRSTVFDRATLSVIAFNAVWISIDTDMNHATLLSDADPIFLVVENFFCFYFTAEWLVRFLCFRKKCDGFKDGWFVFDSLLVCMMVLETWVFTALMALAGVSGSGAGNVGIMRLARLLRLSRMARMGKLLRLMPELMIMIKGMKAAARSVFFTLVLLFVIMYVFCITFVQLGEGTDVGKSHFDAVPSSMYTLLTYGVFLDNVGHLTDKLSSEWILLWLFLVFVLLAAFTVMNMLIGVLCEVVSAVAATEQEEMLVNYVNEKIQLVMDVLDTDGSGMVSKTEFCALLDHDQAVRCLNDVGVDVFALIDLADYIFNQDDPDVTEELELDFTRFMEVVLALRGTNQATVKDILDLRKFMRLSMKENFQQTQMVLDRLDEGRRKTERLFIRSSTHSSRSTGRNGTGSVVLDDDDEENEEAMIHIPSRDVTATSSCNGFEYEERPLPSSPPQTPNGQLLSWVPVGVTILDDAREDAHLTGEWEPVASASLSVHKTTSEESKLSSANTLGLPADRCYECERHVPIGTRTSERQRCKAKDSTTTSALVEMELQGLRSQFEWICKQLASDLGDAINIAGRSVERAHATKLLDVSAETNKAAVRIML